MRPITPSKLPSFQWDRCAFCQENKKDLHRVSEMPVSNRIKENVKFNLKLSIALSNVDVNQQI